MLMNMEVLLLPKKLLNLLDNLERSKISLENDETLKNTEALKKVAGTFRNYK